MKTFLITFLISVVSFAATQTLECAPAADSSTTLNRFTMTGIVETNEKGSATAQLTGTTQMAGLDALVSPSASLNASGSVRVYPAKSLGVDEVTLLQLKSVLNGRVVQLTVASGLKGPQSTMTIQGIPFRAECKLK